MTCIWLIILNSHILYFRIWNFKIFMLIVTYRCIALKKLFLSITPNECFWKYSEMILTPNNMRHKVLIQKMCQLHSSLYTKHKIPANQGLNIHISIHCSLYTKFAITLRNGTEKKVIHPFKTVTKAR